MPSRLLTCVLSPQPNCAANPPASRFNFAVASESCSNAAFLSLRLIAVAQASSSVWTTRRIDTAVCSLLNVVCQSNVDLQVHDSANDRILRPRILTGPHVNGLILLDYPTLGADFLDLLHANRLLAFWPLDWRPRPSISCNAVSIANRLVLFGRYQSNGESNLFSSICG